MTPADEQVPEGPGTGGAAAQEDNDATAVEKTQVEEEAESTSRDANDERNGGDMVAKMAGGDMVAKMAQ